MHTQHNLCRSSGDEVCGTAVYLNLERKKKILLTYFFFLLKFLDLLSNGGHALHFVAFIPSPVPGHFHNSVFFFFFEM